jgi:hypothetical protein
MPHFSAKKQAANGLPCQDSERPPGTGLNVDAQTLNTMGTGLIDSSAGVFIFILWLTAIPFANAWEVGLRFVTVQGEK